MSLSLSSVTVKSEQLHVLDHLKALRCTGRYDNSDGRPPIPKKNSRIPKTAFKIKCYKRLLKFLLYLY